MAEPCRLFVGFRVDYEFYCLAFASCAAVSVLVCKLSSVQAAGAAGVKVVALGMPFAR